MYFRFSNNYLHRDSQTFRIQGLVPGDYVWVMNLNTREVVVDQQITAHEFDFQVPPADYKLRVRQRGYMPLEAYTTHSEWGSVTVLYRMIDRVAYP